VWGMPPDMLKTLPGYGADVKKSRDEARAIMQKLGYGPDKKLKIKVSTRNLGEYRDPAVILIDQLKDIYIDGELDVVETGVWFAKIARGEYSVGLNLTGNGVDDPDQLRPVLTHGQRGVELLKSASECRHGHMFDREAR